jgi:hypothetical protein
VAVKPCSAAELQSYYVAMTLPYADASQPSPSGVLRTPPPQQQQQQAPVRPLAPSAAAPGSRGQRPKLVLPVDRRHAFDFVNPYARPVDDATGQQYIGTRWLQNVRPPQPPSAIPTLPPALAASKARAAKEGRPWRPNATEVAWLDDLAESSRTYVESTVPLSRHTLWLALPDSDEFMVRLAVGFDAGLFSRGIASF